MSYEKADAKVTPGFCFEGVETTLNQIISSSLKILEHVDYLANGPSPKETSANGKEIEETPNIQTLSRKANNIQKILIETELHLNKLRYGK